MPTHAEKAFIITYDISDPRRLARVHRLVSQETLQLQYSVYLLRGPGEKLNELLHKLGEAIHPGEDDIRAYPLPSTGGPEFSGQPPTGPEILLGDLPTDGEKTHPR